MRAGKRNHGIRALSLPVSTGVGLKRTKSQGEGMLALPCSLFDTGIHLLR